MRRSVKDLARDPRDAIGVTFAAVVRDGFAALFDPVLHEWVRAFGDALLSHRATRPPEAARTLTAWGHQEPVAVSGLAIGCGGVQAAHGGQRLGCFE